MAIDYGNGDVFRHASRLPWFCRLLYPPDAPAVAVMIRNDLRSGLWLPVYGVAKTGLNLSSYLRDMLLRPILATAVSIGILTVVFCDGSAPGLSSAICGSFRPIRHSGGVRRRDHRVARSRGKICEDARCDAPAASDEPDRSAVLI